MYINGFDINYIFTKKIIFRYLVLVIPLLTIFITITSYSITSLYNDRMEGNLVKLKVIDDTEGPDISLMCNAVGCTGVIVPRFNNGLGVAEEIYYTNTNGFLKRTEVRPCTNPDEYALINATVKRTLLVYDGIVFIIDDKLFIALIRSIIGYTSVFLLLILTVVYIFYAVISYKNNVIDKISLKNRLEGSLQRDITESLHHEMATPVAIIDTMVTELYERMYPDMNTVKHLDCGDKSDTCAKKEVCLVQPPPMSFYTNIKFGLERLNSTLSLIAGAKHIKYNNGTVSLFMIIENIVATNNSFVVSKADIKYINLPYLKKYAISGGLSNGDMLQILHILVKNSLEAKSNQLTFKAELVSANKLNLYVKDNGRGIRDKNDKIITTDYIFKYGYSTKDQFGNNIVNTTMWNRLLYKLGIEFNSSRLMPRGAGLSVNKGLLTKSGGDMVIKETSPSGTTFMLTIPIKERRDVG